MSKVQIFTGGFYHVFNRGVEKRDIFLDRVDYQRFVNGFRRFNKDGYVRIIAYCLMPNHYHLFLEQLVDGGMAKFMQKLGTGYTMYFNKRYQRSDSLFGSRYRRVETIQDAHFAHVTRYIHLNPLALVESIFKKSDVLNRAMVDTFLKGYEWSSYIDFTEHEITHGFIDPKPVLDDFTSLDEYRDYVLDWYFKVQP